ncbi:hypothetical protein [Aquisalinus flavus]|uniref:Uncharacterized protein n=1 Tax=Aquisalinus flavus TaxID=1526572 RepID=A0A8J2V4G7_9PROT|nr:hypothetical protein [Aquisalinus flavus]MBD0426789.1 hypothetical protein [Aquisalinus flavus]UNE46640.1 hypothetical protein FF099_00490 [Aquisalinus flavus]GGC96022.1 hypothetical protein GCM10011342_01000 [Aquisalinus flavus]
MVETSIDEYRRARYGARQLSAAPTPQDVTAFVMTRIIRALSVPMLALAALAGLIVFGGMSFAVALLFVLLIGVPTSWFIWRL